MTHEDVMSDNYWFIKKCNLFTHLSSADIAGLESRSRMRKLKRGEPVYLPHEEADGILLVTEGRVKICHTTPDGKQSILGFVDAGEIFGELALVSDQPRNEYAETTEKTTLVLLPKRELTIVTQKYPSIALGVSKLIGIRRQRIERRLRNLLFRSNRERIIHLMLELTEKYGQRVDDGVHLGIRLSHQDMASIIGSTRETVTVVLGQLQSEGLVTISRRRLTLTDLETLAREVNEPCPLLPNEKTMSRLGVMPNLSGNFQGL
jgi:CRP-like cAMP-binding protein